MEQGLYLVATPIGNLQDITIRALHVLNHVDVILCEDTRVSRVLLSHYKIYKKTISYYEHNEKNMQEYVLKMLILEKKSLALISDAGTPLISDPGYKLVVKALNNNISVFPIPGPSSIIAALCIAGLPTDSFCFAGFIPVKGRNAFIEKFGYFSITTIFFETSRRLQKTLQMMSVLWPKRKASIVRELTKKYESCVRGTLEDFSNDLPFCKGEIVLLLEGIIPNHVKKMDLGEFVKTCRKKGMNTKEIAYVLQKEFHLSSKEAYRTVLYYL